MKAFPHIMARAVIFSISAQRKSNFMIFQNEKMLFWLIKLEYFAKCLKSVSKKLHFLLIGLIKKPKFTQSYVNLGKY